MNYDRNTSGTFNNSVGLGNTWTQNQAGVNSWDSSYSAMAKMEVFYREQGKLPIVHPEAPEPPKSFSYKLAFMLGQLFKK